MKLRKRGTFKEPVYAVKVLFKGGVSPYAHDDQRRMTETRRWRRARGRNKWSYKGGVARKPAVPYGNPQLCVQGYHAWPFRSPSQAESWESGWRNSHRSREREIWVVQLRGRYECGMDKICADEMRYVRRLTPAETRVITRNRDGAALRRLLDLDAPLFLAATSGLDWPGVVE